MINRSVRMNYHTNLLELEEHMYPLVDVETPNVFHNLFPYTMKCRRSRLMTVSCRITCRMISGSRIPHSGMDSKSRAPYTGQSRSLQIYDYLHRLGGANGKIRQSEFFLIQQKRQRRRL